MISLTCAQCRNTLEVDDAFAGGVCRCQFCGTIQTVPRPGSRPSAPGAPGSAVAHSAAGGDEPRALYQVKSRTGVSSHPSGLEELAEVVHSSGLSGSGLAHRTGRGLTYATPQQQKSSNRTTVVAIASAVVLLALAGAGFWMFAARTTVTSTTGGSGTPTPAVVIPSTPSFGKIDLAVEKVVYLVDRGDATAQYFEPLKKLVERSVASLGSDRRFQVIAWENASQDAYPRNGLGYATAEELEKLGKWFDNLATGQATSIDSGLAAALAGTPDVIVILTAKSDQLDTDFAANVLGKVKGKTVKVSTVTLGESPPDDPLKKIALDTHGTFEHLTRDQLSAVE